MLNASYPKPKGKDYNDKFKKCVIFYDKIRDIFEIIYVTSTLLFVMKCENT